MGKPEVPVYVSAWPAASGRTLFEARTRSGIFHPSFNDEKPIKALNDPSGFIMTVVFEQPSSPEAIAELHTRSRQVAYRGLYGDDYLDRELLGVARRQWRERFEIFDPRHDFLIAARQAGQCIGFAYASSRPECGNGVLLDNMHVDPDAKYRGIGTRMLSCVAEWAVGQMRDWSLFVEAYAFNEAANAFYVKRGAIRISEYQETAPGGKPAKVLRYRWRDPSMLIKQSRD